MKSLQIMNAVLAATGAAIGLVLAVVCAIYWAHLDAAPKIRAELPLLVAATGVFLALMAGGLLAFVGHRRQWPLRWGLQALPPLSLAGIAMFFSTLSF